MGIFGRKNKDKGAGAAAAPPANPYATSAPTADPYQQARSQGANGYGARPGAYQAAPAQAAPYGQTQSPYGGSSQSYGRPQQSNGGGYAGLGPVDDDGQKAALFGGAAQRQQQRPQDQHNAYGGSATAAPSRQTATDADRSALFGGAAERAEENQSGYGALDAADGGYGGGRQLTAEEEEEEEVQATKQQIRELKQEDLSSTRNALRVAADAEASGRATLERLGVQGERIHNAERNLDLAHNQNKIAEEKARELKHLNRSMFAVHVNNPFTKTRREQEREDAIMQQHRIERAEREATRASAYTSMMRREQNQKQLNHPKNVGPGGAGRKTNLAERNKYQFEADSDDDAMEDELDNNLDSLSGAAGRLNILGRAMGDEVERQNEVIDGIANKATRVDDGIAINSARIRNIR